MNKEQFLEALKSELKKHNVPDTDDIILEYGEHFDCRIAQGATEHEIAAKLGKPQTIAEDFISQDESDAHKSPDWAAKHLSSFLMLPVSLIAVLLWLCIAVIAIASIASAFIGICLVFRQSFNIIPAMPYACALLFALCFLSLSVLMAVVCYYCGRYVISIYKAGLGARRNMLSGGKLDGSVVKPVLNGKLKSLAEWSAAVFAASLIIAYISCAVISGSLEFWHAWNWFM